MIDKIKLLAGISIVTATSISCANQQASLVNSRPNIVFILVDDLGWADLPPYGNQFNEAPRISRMAEEGIMFTNAYAACPVCSPTRASIQSGQYAARVGIIDFIPGHWRPFEEVIVPTNRTQYLPPDITTIGEAMQLNGYKTAYFGKWHLGNASEQHPGSRGYEAAIEYTGGGYFNPVFSPPYRDFEPDQVLSDILTDMSIDFINKNKDDPFFLFLSHYDVHVLLDADAAVIKKYLQKDKVEGYPCNAVYAAMIEHVDNSIGRILDALDALELAENTLVVLYSDNGGLVSRFDKLPIIFADKQHVYEGDSMLTIATVNTPLRSEKGSLYEGGIRVPMVVRWKGTIQPGMVTGAKVISPDFFPTFVALAGGDLPNQQHIDGKNIIPELLGWNPEPERSLYWHYPVYHHDVPASAIIKGNWKLIETLTNGSLELYDLSADISESINLAEQAPELVMTLKAELSSWRMDVGARTPIPNPDFDPKRRHIWGKHPGR